MVVIYTNVNSFVCKESGVLFNLLLTEFCNFSCDRCFFASSPQKPIAYMSDEVLAKVDQQLKLAEQISEFSIPTVNVIGGEPTVNFAKFEAIINKWFIEKWLHEYEFEMSTNGFWFELEPKRTIKYLKLFERIAEDYQFYNPDIPIVRISTSLWHDNYYKNMSGSSKNGEEYLTKLLNMYRDMEMFICNSCGEQLQFRYSENWYCDSCDSCCLERYDDECPECGNDLVKNFCKHCEQKFQSHQNFCPQCNTVQHCEQGCGEGWCVECGSTSDIYTLQEGILYIDSWSDNYISTGAAAQNLGHSPNTIELTCNHKTLHNIVTIHPDGSVTDMCCRGSQFTGNILETSFLHVLYAWNKMFEKVETLRCSDCNMCTNDYVEENQQSLREIYSQPLLILLANNQELTVYPDSTFTIR